MAASTAKNAEFDHTYLGDTVGRWEGDTLVLDSVAFTDTTWLGRGGFFHSDQMHVVERFKRQGDALLYDVTVEDPEVLAEPWVFPTRMVRRNPNPDAGPDPGARQLRGSGVWPRRDPDSPLIPRFATNTKEDADYGFHQTHHTGSGSRGSGNGRLAARYLLSRRARGTGKFYEKGSCSHLL